MYNSCRWLITKPDRESSMNPSYLRTSSLVRFITIAYLRSISTPNSTWITSALLSARLFPTIPSLGPSPLVLRTLGVLLPSTSCQARQVLPRRDQYCRANMPTVTAVMRRSGAGGFGGECHQTSLGRTPRFEHVHPSDIPRVFVNRAGWEDNIQTPCPIFTVDLQGLRRGADRTGAVLLGLSKLFRVPMTNTC